MGALHAVVMAGGSGTRFWPASRTERPKQVLPLAGGEPLIAATLARLGDLCDPEHVWIVTNGRQVDAVRRAAPRFPGDKIIVEPEARDTAACVSLATATIAAADPDATMVVLPSDHLIEPAAEFRRMIRRGAELAADDETLVTFGVAPGSAATGFGYVECGEPCDDREPPAFRATRFREKPDAATARQFVDDGLLWNLGIFVWTCRGVVAAMAASDPALATATVEMAAAIADGRPTADVFGKIRRTSIDYAVLEHAPKVAVVRAAVAWNDVGGFGALADTGADDGAGNRALLTDGASRIALESRNNLVYAEGKRAVCLFGVDDLVVVAVGDAVLVCPRSRAAELKRLVEHVRAQGRDDLL